MMMYDTPGSQVMRKTGFNFEIDHENQKMEMSMVSPWKTAQFEGQYQTFLLGDNRPYLLKYFKFIFTYQCRNIRAIQTTKLLV